MKLPQTPLRRASFWAALFVAAGISRLPAAETRNVFLITTDGLRPREVFAGAEEALLIKENTDGSARATEMAPRFSRGPAARRGISSTGSVPA